jgi:hypothetical protein
MRRPRWRRQLKRHPEREESQRGNPERLPDPDQAWKALSLVNDWIRHAEAKATAALAASGVTAGVLYNLFHSQAHPSLILSIVVTINVITIIASAGSAVMALVPRLTVRKAKPDRVSTHAVTQVSAPSAAIPEDPVNLLFFRDIARHYRGDAPTYTQVLSTLTSDPIKLTEYIGHQVHANSDVAHRKYGWANRASVGLAADLIMLGITAILTAHW